MTTTSKKEEIAAEYGIDEHGLITSPGRYEREPWYLVALDELDETEGFGDASEGNGYFSLFILDPDMQGIDAELIAATGKRGFIMSLSTDGFRCIEDEFDTEAEAREAFANREREYQLDNAPEDDEDEDEDE